MATPKKSANISSTMGRMPSTAAPTPRPMNAVSEMGVSITRSGPNLSSRPVVEPKIPPYLATSSPSTTTPASRSISWEMPSTMARAVDSRRTVAPAGAAADSVTLICVLPSREHVLERRLRRWHRAGLSEVDGLLHPGHRLLLDAAGQVRVEDPGPGQPRLVRRDGISARHIGQVGAVSLGVALEVTPQPHGVHLDQGRPLAGPGPRHCVTGRRVHGLDVVVLDPPTGHAIGGGPVRVRADSRGRLPGHGDGPLIVLDHEDHRQLPQRGQVQ